MKTSHTPGPWLIHQANGPIQISHAGSMGKVATIADNSKDQRIACANARLIAAAPELLDALELAEAALQRLAPDGSRATQGTRDVIRAAIAKATQP